MTSLPSELRPLQFTLLFLRYAFYPNEDQKSHHSFAIIVALKWILRDFVIHGIFHIICWYFLSNNFVLSLGANAIFIIYDIIELIGGISFLRDCIIWDLHQYLSYHASYNVRSSYRYLKFSINEYLSYLRYYDYNQDKQDICAICMEQYTMNPHEPNCVIKCGHRFHDKCLDNYEKSIIRPNMKPKWKCPCCRRGYIPTTSTFIFYENYYQKTSIWYKQIPKFIKPTRDKLIKIREYTANICISWLWLSNN